MAKLEDYTEIVGAPVIEELKRAAAPLAGRSVVHVNSTRRGGGVAEMLHSLVPLFNELGLEARWEVLQGTPLFFQATKTLHNALQGQPLKLTPGMAEEYRRVNEENAQRLDLDADFVIVHDPQPAALIAARRDGRCRWIWRCHIDLSTPQPWAWEFLKGHISRYDVAIFSLRDFLQELPTLLYLIPPAIDPLSPKNRELSAAEIERVYEALGVPRDKPVLLQVSRFDPHKDPLGVIEAYRLVKQEHDCRLVLAGGMATDDPEGAEMLQRVREEAADDPDIHVLPPPSREELSDEEINALQRGATVIIQKSLREGFGLTVTEALWKAKPVVTTAAGGLKLQVLDGQTGLVARSTEEMAAQILRLMREPELARRLGEAGREHVRKHFLITRQLHDYLRLFSLIKPC